MASPHPDLPKSPPGQDELPYQDGEPMDSPRHRRQMNLLIESLVEAFPERRDMYVGGNMFVWYSELQTKTQDVRGPDVFVVLGARAGRRRKSWVVWEEGKLPDVVVELTSESTEHVDRGEKKQIYERVWHLPEYFLFDPETKRLEGWRLEGERFVAIDPEPNGDLACRVLGLRLGVREGCYLRDQTGWLRWIDPASDTVLPSSREQAIEARAEAERARAEAERAQAEAERAREAVERAREAAALERAHAEVLELELAELRKRAGEPPKG